jgi:hypothetical protein
MTEDERRQRARELIQEAFAERPLKLIEGEVFESEAAETLASERTSMGESVGRASATEATIGKPGRIASVRRISLRRTHDHEG